MSPLAALQDVLAAEHAAVHLLGTLGGQTSQSRLPDRFALVTERHAVHRRRRDELVVAVRRRDGTPVAAAAAYELPPLGRPALVAAAGLELERRCAQAYAALVAAGTGSLRGWAIEALAETALAQLAWGGDPESFPGAPEL